MSCDSVADVLIKKLNVALCIVPSRNCIAFLVRIGGFLIRVTKNYVGLKGFWFQ